MRYSGALPNYFVFLRLLRALRRLTIVGPFVEVPGGCNAICWLLGAWLSERGKAHNPKMSTLLRRPVSLRANRLSFCESGEGVRLPRERG